MSGAISLKWAVTLLAGLIVAIAVLVASMGGGGGEEASSSGYSAEEQAAYDDAAEWCERPDVQERAGTTLESQLLLARSYPKLPTPAQLPGCSAQRDTAASTLCRRSPSRGRCAVQEPALSARRGRRGESAARLSGDRNATPRALAGAEPATSCAPT